ncbi:LapA family protein [Actibacterium sp. XHP0104]|nr:LapA family protein [Actibacterium sp. XHP0104]MCV2882179.1 LapA family protein [Actibacterium sp. XHP0104]
MRYLRYGFLAVLGICLITVALANRQVVTLRLLPEEMAHYTGLTWAIELPLFLVVFGGIIAGLLIGFFWEWLREAKHRAKASQAQRDARVLEREVKRLRKDKPEHKDEVLALLEGGGKAG